MRLFTRGYHYHLISRGNNKENIFEFKRDYTRYTKLLEKCSNRYSIEILAFVLMPNHTHLLVKQESYTPISKFMQALNTAYSMYFNLRHSRIGHLFQGKFKYILVEDDDYLVHLSRYIHLNPTSANLVKKPEEYQWGSYRSYLGVEKEHFIHEKLILDQFSKKDPVGDYKEFV